MKKVITAVVVILAIAAVVWALYQGQQGSVQLAPVTNLGTYPYMCDNGGEFTLTPIGDLTTVQVYADAQGMFTGTTTLNQIEGTSYSGTAPDGQSVAIVGDGETVHMTVGGEQATCNPVPNADSAPWDWGDATATTTTP